MILEITCIGQCVNWDIFKGKIRKRLQELRKRQRELMGTWTVRVPFWRKSERAIYESVACRSHYEVGFVLGDGWVLLSLNAKNFYIIERNRNICSSGRERNMKNIKNVCIHFYFGWLKKIANSIILWLSKPKYICSENENRLLSLSPPFSFPLSPLIVIHATLQNILNHYIAILFLIWALGT